MKIFGYTNSGSDHLIALKEVTFQCDPREARALADFFLQCSIELESIEDWEHAHLKDYLNDENIFPDVIIYKG